MSFRIHLCICASLSVCVFLSQTCSRACWKRSFPKATATPSWWCWASRGDRWAEEPPAQPRALSFSPFFLKHLRFCRSRWAVFFRGTRTNAERWCSWTGTRRKSSRWTMTPFATTSGRIVDHYNLFFFCNSLAILTCNCVIKNWKGFVCPGFTAALITIFSGL